MSVQGADIFRARGRGWGKSENGEAQGTYRTDESKGTKGGNCSLGFCLGCVCGGGVVYGLVLFPLGTGLITQPDQSEWRKSIALVTDS